MSETGSILLIVFSGVISFILVAVGLSLFNNISGWIAYKWSLRNSSSEKGKGVAQTKNSK